MLTSSAERLASGKDLLFSKGRQVKLSHGGRDAFRDMLESVNANYTFDAARELVKQSEFLNFPNILSYF